MLAAILALAAAIAASGTASGAEGHRGPGPTPPRISFIDGDVSFWRPGAEDWAPAKVNTPLAPGDEVYAGDNGNVELQLAPRAFVRGGAGAEIGLTALEESFLQFKVTAGHAAVDVRERDDRTIEIDTPQGAFTIEQPGYYRVDVDEHRTTFVTRRGGKATVVPAGGQETDVDPDKQVVLEGNEDHADLTTRSAPDPDDWDRWNTERTERLTEPRSARYVPRGVSGVDELDQYGSWRDDPKYGATWVPAAVPPEWVPYSTGRWVWDPYYGWTWIEDAPWGWAPFHYGRWEFVGGVWAWIPGPVVAVPLYAPALVAFFEPPHVGVSVSIGFGGGGFLGWVALGFGEPLIPWWGPPGFIGTCWWGGWGGPRIVNNVVIEKNTYVDARHVTVFKNTQVNNAVVAVERNRFGRPDVKPVRLPAEHARQLRPVRGNLAVRPTPASLVPAAGRGVRPPEHIRRRPVVATRPPEDPRPHLRASGLNPARVESPPPRLVRPSRAARGAPEHQHAPGPRERLARPAPAPPPPPAARRAPREPGPPRERPSGAVTSGTHAPAPLPGPPHAAPPRPRPAFPAYAHHAPAPGYPPVVRRPFAPALPAPVPHGRRRHAAVSPERSLRALMSVRNPSKEEDAS